MNYYRFPENRVTKALFALFLFALLYLARDTMFCLYVIGFYPSQFISYGLMGAAGLAFLYHNRTSLKEILRDGRVGAAIGVTAVILLPMILKGDWQFMYFSILICLYCAIFLTYFLTLAEAAKYYVVILTVLGVYSILAAYILRLPIDYGWVEMEFFRNGVHNKFYNFIFSVVPMNFVKNRNFGIFREPGVYQYFILLALYLTHYTVQWRKEWTKWVTTAILCATMLSTFATGGVAEMGLLALFVFFEKKLYKNKILVAVVLVLAVALGYFLYDCYDKQNELWIEIEMMVFTKFSKQEDSFTERGEAIMNNLRIFLNHPILGDDFSNVLHSSENNTTSTLILYAAFGLFSGSLHLLTWGAMVWRKERNWFWNLVLMGILFLSFNTQNLTWDLFFWLFPMMALTERGVPAAQNWLARRRAA